MHYAFYYLMHNYLKAESDYKYTGLDEKCKTPQPVTEGEVTLSWYYTVKANNPKAHMWRLNHGPTTIALTVCDQAYQNYAGGIMTYDCGD